MNGSGSPLHWSIPCGTWFSTRVRVSVFFPLLLIVLWFQFHRGSVNVAETGGFENWFLLANVFALVLFCSVLLHEYGHILAARLTGGHGDEILIWPLGGLAFTQPAPTFRSRFLTAAAGPLVDAGLCLATLGAVLRSPAEIRNAVFHPFQFPAITLGEAWATDLMILVFTANWILLLINLLPVHPLDGGRMLHAALSTRWQGENGGEIYLRIGFLVAFLMLFGGLIAQSVWLVFIGAVVLVLNMQESVQHARGGEVGDESFMGYDFSQGYTSLERSADSTVVEKRRSPGFFERWKEKRRHARERRRREQLEQAEQQLDALLQKVSDLGMQSLTEAERRALEQASDRLRHKDKPA
ncbi:MAG: M50 family metallopeptidase [Planctomycetaceae bacterium]